MPENKAGVYRELNAEMRDGLKQIYKQISSAHLEGEAPARQEALFSEASDQLKEVVKATESAAMNIMDIVEKQLDGIGANRTLLQSLREKYPAEAQLGQLEQSLGQLDTDLTNVLTALSFQDITGQRIRKVMEALRAIETSVVELYLSSGLAMAAAEENPGKDMNLIHQEARQAVAEYKANGGSELKGPDVNGISQSAIDDMLAQLGM